MAARSCAGTVGSTSNIIRCLVDVVSKNDILLRNVPPLVDGGFTPEVRRALEAVGLWLEVNGEAIYGTSPWFLFGEGPTTIGNGNDGYHHNDHFGRLVFTHEDIRFTTNGPSLYATCLGRPSPDDPCVQYDIQARHAACRPPSGSR